MRRLTQSDGGVRLAEGNDGALYGITAHGGIADYGTILKLNKDGNGFVVLHEFRGSEADGYWPIGLLQARDGTLYGSTTHGGTNGGGSFGCGSGINLPVGRLAVQGDGKVKITGAFSYIQGILCNGIARLMSDGKLDQSFDPGRGVTRAEGTNEYSGYAYCALGHPNGKVLIGGGFDIPSSL